MRYLILVLLLGLAITSCNENRKIMELLESDQKEDVIKGAFKAGETKKKVCSLTFKKTL